MKLAFMAAQLQQFERIMFWMLAKRTTPIFRRQISSFCKIDKKPDLYSLIEVKPTSTAKEIQYSYYRLSRKYNSSGSSDPLGHSRLLNEAFLILSNQKLRQKYDKDHNFNQGDKKPQKVFGNRTVQIEREFKKTKSSMDELIGDKSGRLQQKLVTVVFICSLIATSVIIFAKDPNQKKKSPSLSS